MERDAARWNWWRRNWRWVVPAGCLGTILLIIGPAVVLFTIVVGSIKGHEVYTGALAAARSNPELREAIGTPMEDGFFPSGSFEVSGPSGYAEAAIAVSGPKDSATVYLVAEKNVGDWSYAALAAEVDDSNRRIDLLADAPTTMTAWRPGLAATAPRLRVRARGYCGHR